MKSLCWLLCSSLVFGAACRKKRAAAPVSPETAVPAVADQLAAASTSPTPPSAPGKPATAVVPESIDFRHFRLMTDALLKFKRDKHRAPKDWQELITTGYLKQMPTPPPGKAYVFNNYSLDVRMVNQ